MPVCKEFVSSSGLLWQLLNKAASQLIQLPAHSRSTSAKEAPQMIQTLY
jgi:hypothetical protein